MHQAVLVALQPAVYHPLSACRPYILSRLGEYPCGNGFFDHSVSGSHPDIFEAYLGFRPSPPVGAVDARPV